MSSTILRPRSLESQPPAPPLSRWLASGQRFWRFNPGFCVALVSGSVGMLLAFWLLLSQFAIWLAVPRPVPRPTRTPLFEASSQWEKTLGLPPLDRRGPRFAVNLQVQDREPLPPPESPGDPEPLPRLAGPPLEPEFASEWDLPEPQPVVGRFERRILIPADDLPRFEQPPDTPLEPEEPPAVIALTPIADEPVEEVVEELPPSAPLEPLFAEADEAWSEELSEELPEGLLPEFAELTAPPSAPSSDWVAARPRAMPEDLRAETAAATTRVLAQPVPMAPPERVTIPAVAEHPATSNQVGCDLPLSLQWHSAGKATAGRLHRLVLLVRNRGEVPLAGVTLLTRLPEAVWHARGEDLELELPSLAPGEIREIPLWIRPRTDEPVVLRTRGISACGEVSTAGVLHVQPKPSSLAGAEVRLRASRK